MNIATLEQYVENKNKWRAVFNQEPLRSEEHTSELQSLTNLVCRLLLEKKKRGEGTRS